MAGLQARQAVFAELRPVCAQLLMMRNEPEALHKTLLALQEVLGEVDVQGLAACWDYVLYPLVMMLDCLPEARKNKPPSTSSSTSGTSSKAKPPAGQPQAVGDADSAVAVPAMKSDRVAEAVLGCLQLMTSLCVSLVEEDQLSGLLQRLAPLIDLPADNTSEEVRLGVLKCLCLLMPTQPSLYEPPPRKESILRPSDLTAGLDLDLDLDLDIDKLIISDGARALEEFESGYDIGAEPLIGPPAVRSALRKTDAAPMVGFLIHSCLAVAEAEAVVLTSPPEVASRKAPGSVAVCSTALQVLQGLTCAVADPAGLAFFLPGLASGLSKLVLILGSGGISSGGSNTALATTLNCLCHVIAVTLSDQALQQAGVGPHVSKPLVTQPASTAPASTSTPADHARGVEDPQLSPEEASNVAAALAKLQDMISVMDIKSDMGSVSDMNEMMSKVAPSSALPIPQQPGGGQVGGRQFRVVINDEWVIGSVTKLLPMLKTVLPLAAGHPRPSVRAALASGLVELLSSCQAALGQEGQSLVLNQLLGLAQDDAHAVAAPALTFLQQPLPTTTPTTTPTATNPASDAGAAPSAQSGLAAAGAALPSPAPPRLPAALLHDLVAGLLPAVKSGGQAAVIHARKLSSALVYAGYQEVSQQLLQRPSLLTHLLSSLSHCFAYDESAAKQILTSQGHTSSSTAGSRYLPASSTPAVSTTTTTTGQNSSSSSSTTTASAGSASSSQHHTAAAGSTATPVHLPASSESGPSASTTATASATLAAPSIPRPPSLAQHLITLQLYEAVADVARTLGHMAHVADEHKASGYRSHLKRVMDKLLTFLETALSRGRASRSAHPSSTKHHKRGSRQAGAVSETVQEVEEAWVDGAMEVSSSWQCAAVSVVAVASEVLLGSSPAWLPKLDLTTPTRTAKDPSVPPSTPGSTKSLEACLAALLDVTLLDQGLMSCPTSKAAADALSGADGSNPPAYTVQEVAENALLARSLLDLASTAARALGQRLTQQGALLRSLLIPALERAADPCAPVCAAAHDTLSCLAVFGGYGSLRQLVAVNADYVVDAVCGQLRDLQAHPHAPRLLAALLRMGGGVAPALLPVMAEPLSTALRAYVRLLMLNSWIRSLAGAECWTDGPDGRGDGPHRAGGGSAIGDLAPGGSSNGSMSMSNCTPSLCTCTAMQPPCNSTAMQSNACPWSSLLCESTCTCTGAPGWASRLGVVLMTVSGLSRRVYGMYRRAAPANVHPFALVLSEVARGTAEEGAAAAGLAVIAQEHIKERVAIMRREREAQVEAKATQAAQAAAAGAPSRSSASATSAIPIPGTETDVRNGSQGTSVEEIKAYFEARAEARAEQSGPGGTHLAEEPEDPDAWLRGVMGTSDIALLDDRFRRLHAVAVSAGAAADAAIPLMLSRDLKVAVSAIEALTASVSALSKVTPALDVDKQLLEELGPRGMIRPVQPESPKLLPAVASAWPLLMESLKDSRTPLVEASLSLLVCVIKAAGGVFMARRFTQEAGPLLSRLLAHGTAHVPSSSSLTPTSHTTGVPQGSTSHGLRQAGEGPGTSWNALAGAEESRGLVGPGGGSADAGDGLAEGALVRVRLAALGCIQAVCSAQAALSAVKGHTWGLASLCAPFLSCDHPPALQEAASAALQSLAGVDPDSVWLLMADIQLQGGQGLGLQVPAHPDCLPLNKLLPQPASSQRHTSGFSSRRGSTSGRASAGGAGCLPSATAMSSNNNPWPVNPGMAEQCQARARAISKDVELVCLSRVRTVPLIVE